MRNSVLIDLSTATGHLDRESSGADLRATARTADGVRMHVLLLCHALPPGSVGGVEQHVDGLAQALCAQGDTVHVYARDTLHGLPQGTHRLEREASPRITRVAYRWEGLRGLDDLYEVPELDRAFDAFLATCAARGERFDVAHVHHLTGMSTGLLDRLAAAGIPTVMTLHDYWLPCPRGQMFHRHESRCDDLVPSRCGPCLEETFPHWISHGSGEQTAQRLHERAARLLRVPAALVVPSGRALPPFAQLGLEPSRVHVVENGVDTHALGSLPDPACGPGPLRLGYLGTLLPSKGLAVLVQAVQRQPRGTVQLDIHGNAVPYHGDNGYLTRVFGTLQPGDPVHYHGPYGAADLPRILEAMDVACAPALWHEAFGLTVREALAAGRPILVSRVGGLQDAVADGVGGRVLPPGDVTAWAEAIAALAADRAATRRMARQARGQARSFAAMASQLTGIYRAAVASPRRA